MFGAGHLKLLRFKLPVFYDSNQEPALTEMGAHSWQLAVERFSKDNIIQSYLQVFGCEFVKIGIHRPAGHGFLKNSSNSAKGLLSRA